MMTSPMVSGFAFGMLHIHMFFGLIALLSLVGLFIWALKHMKAEDMKRLFIIALIVGVLGTVLTSSFSAKALMGKNSYKLKGQNQLQTPKMMNPMINDDY